MTTITVFKGDGIGPEITDAVIKVLNAANADLDYEIFNVGQRYMMKLENIFQKMPLRHLKRIKSC